MSEQDQTVKFRLVPEESPEGPAAGPILAGGQRYHLVMHGTLTNTEGRWVPVEPDRKYRPGDLVEFRYEPRDET